MESYVSDTTNASRTLLFNCLTNEWDQELLNIFDIKKLNFQKLLIVQISLERVILIKFLIK